MKSEYIKVGVRVKTLREFCCVPKGTEGVIDELYSIAGLSAGPGFMVAWDLEEQPLPKGYRQHDGKPAFVSNLLRDGFNIANEAHYLELA